MWRPFAADKNISLDNSIMFKVLPQSVTMTMLMIITMVAGDEKETIKGIIVFPFIRG